MNNKKHLYDRIFKWCADVGHCPLESDMNELIDFIMDDDPKSEGGSPFAPRETDIPEFGGKSPQPEPVASGKTANTERKNASDYWAKHNAPEPEKAQGVDSVDTLSGREPPADLSLSDLKRECRDKCGLDLATDKAAAYEVIDYLHSQGRISGVSKEGEE